MIEDAPQAVKREVTDKEIEELKKQSERLLNSLSSSFVRGKPEDLQLASAARNYQCYLSDLRHCAEQVQIGGMDEWTARERIDTALEQVAHALLTMGHADTALTFAQASGNQQIIDHVGNLLDAIERDDSEFCDCEPQRVDGQVIPVHHEIGKLFSPQHGGFTPIIHCAACNQINVTHSQPEVFFDKHTLPQTTHLGKPLPDHLLFKAKQ